MTGICEHPSFYGLPADAKRIEEMFAADSACWRNGADAVKIFHQPLLQHHKEYLELTNAVATKLPQLSCRNFSIGPARCEITEVVPIDEFFVINEMRPGPHWLQPREHAASRSRYVEGPNLGDIAGKVDWYFLERLEGLPTAEQERIQTLRQLMYQDESILRRFNAGLDQFSSLLSSTFPYKGIILVDMNVKVRMPEDTLIHCIITDLAPKVWLIKKVEF